MPTTDYLIFIHGVATRDNGLPPTYSDYLFSLIEKKCHELSVDSTLIPVPLYWGDVSKADEALVLSQERASSIYAQFDAKDMRENFVLPFVGDAVAYISRFLGGRIVEKLKADAQARLSKINPKDDNRFHLIGHSWGTVILFDILFASRWNDPSVFGAASVMEMRDIIFGLQPSPLNGVVVRSIHTMGSPLDIFSLMELTSTTFKRTPEPVIPPVVLEEISMRVRSRGNSNEPMAIPSFDGRAGMIGTAEKKTAPMSQFLASADAATAPETHAIAPNLRELLKTLHAYLGRPLNWYNFSHPGDFVAYPIEKLMPLLLGNPSEFLNVQDFLVTDAGPQFLEGVEPITMIHAGAAHQSYWKSHLVAEQIAGAIKLS